MDVRAPVGPGQERKGITEQSMSQKEIGRNSVTKTRLKIRIRTHK